MEQPDIDQYIRDRVRRQVSLHAARKIADIVEEIERDDKVERAALKLMGVLFVLFALAVTICYVW